MTQKGDLGICNPENSKHSMENVFGSVYMGQSIQNGPNKIWSYPLKIFKGCLPQILHGPLLNTLSHIMMPKTISQNPKYSDLRSVTKWDMNIFMTFFPSISKLLSAYYNNKTTKVSSVLIHTKRINSQLH